MVPSIKYVVSRMEYLKGFTPSLRWCFAFDFTFSSSGVRSRTDCLEAGGRGGGSLCINM